MKSLLFLGTYTDLNQVVPNLKNKLIEYFGYRMVAEEAEDFPALVLTDCSDKDLEYINQLLSATDVSVAVIDCETKLTGGLLSNIVFLYERDPERQSVESNISQ